MYEHGAVARSRLFPPSQQSVPPSALEDKALSKSAIAAKRYELSHLDRLTVPIQHYLYLLMQLGG